MEFQRTDIKQLEVRALVSSGNHFLKEWREFPSSDLPALIKSVAHLKEFLNNFLVNVQNQRGSAQEEGSAIYSENFEEDEEKEDPLLGTIQELRNLKELSKSIKKENKESTYCQRAKKMKK